MSTETLEQRVAALESQMAQLLLRKRVERSKDWRRTIGMFTGDEVMWAIDQNALAFREEDRDRTLAELDAQQGPSS